MVARRAVCLHGAGEEGGVHRRAEGAETQKVDHNEWQEPSAEVLLLCSCSHPCARHKRLSSTPFEQSACRTEVLNIEQKGPHHDILFSDIRNALLVSSCFCEYGNLRLSERSIRVCRIFVKRHPSHWHGVRAEAFLQSSIQDQAAHSHE
jgi:hypothetical protein